MTAFLLLRSLAKLLLSPKQFQAVGYGGMFPSLVISTKLF